MAKTLNIVLLEDNPLDAELTLDALAVGGIGFEATRVERREPFLQALRSGPDLILADYSLPQFNGLEALELARQECAHVPFLFVSGALGEELAIETLRRGATDYVLKHRLDRLVPSVERALQEAEDRSERRRLEQELRERAAVLEATVRERDQALDALQASEQAYRLQAEAIPQIVWAARGDGHRTYFNQRWYDYTGLTPEESTGDGWSLAVHPEDLPLVRQRWQEATASGQPFQVELRLRDRTGDYRWFLARALPQRDGDGSVTRWLGTSTDVDDQKRVMQELAEADARKNEFLAMLAHELRNPLTPMFNALFLMQHGDPLPPSAARAREVVERQARHMARLLDDLLDLSRISRGKILLRRKPMDLAALVRETVEDHREALNQVGVSLAARLPEGELPALGDPTRLSQVVGNLLNNAAKFTPSGGSVWVELEASGSGEAVLRVRDTGIGIRPETLPRIFEPFIQERRTPEQNATGLGLGLALVRGLVELHGGRIEAYSAGENAGTEFTLHLPLEAAVVEPARAPHPEAELSTPAAASRRILVIDDNQDAADTLRDLLEIYGHLVQVTYTGSAGVRQAAEFLPDVVLCDLGLPDMDGFEVARALRGSRDTAGARLIAISGYGREEDRKRAIDSGFDLHLTKPVDPSVIAELLAG